MLFTVDNFFKHCSCLGISFGIEKNLTLECIGAILCDAAFRITASVGREGCDGVTKSLRMNFLTSSIEERGFNILAKSSETIVFSS